MSADEDAHRTRTLVEQISPILKGQPPELQSAALADLLAIWLAGHVVLGDPAATLRQRTKLLSMFVKLVIDLVEVNAEAMGTDQLMDVQGGKQ